MFFCFFLLFATVTVAHIFFFVVVIPCHTHFNRIKCWLRTVFSRSSLFGINNEHKAKVMFIMAIEGDDSRTVYSNDFRDLDRTPKLGHLTVFANEIELND